MTDSTNTVFDDVFRTMLAKMPELIIPLINEVFDTDYPYDIPIIRYQDEFYDRRKKMIADSHFGIAHIHYHAECQSTGDPTMHVRMLEYDTAIGLEYLSCIDGELHLSLPQSFVLYLASTSKTVLPSINIHFTNNCNVLYHPRPVYLSDYSLEEIFQKNLIFLLPFYIIRYRYKNNTGQITEDSNTFRTLLKEYRSIRKYLTDRLFNQEKEHFYLRIIELINRIINYIFTDNDAVRKGLGDIMGGQILELETDRLIENSIEQGRKRGIEQERESSIRILIHILQKKNFSRNEICDSLATDYQLSSNEIESYLTKYWEN